MDEQFFKHLGVIYCLVWLCELFVVELQLARYLNRSYWEDRSERQTSRDTSSPSASAPVQREELNNYSDQVF